MGHAVEMESTGFDLWNPRELSYAKVDLNIRANDTNTSLKPFPREARLYLKITERTHFLTEHLDSNFRGWQF